MFAQLRDVLVAEDSAVVAKKDDDGGIALPERAEADFLAVRIWKNDIGESLAESFVHVKLSSTSLQDTVKRWAGMVAERIVNTLSCGTLPCGTSQNFDRQKSNS